MVLSKHNPFCVLISFLNLLQRHWFLGYHFSELNQDPLRFTYLFVVDFVHGRIVFRGKGMTGDQVKKRTEFVMRRQLV